MTITPEDREELLSILRAEMEQQERQKEELMELRITEDRRVLLNGQEISACTKATIFVEAGRDPEVELRIAVDKVNIDGYTNGTADLIFPSHSNT